MRSAWRATGGLGLAGSEMPVIVHGRRRESGWNHPDAIHGNEKKKKKRFRNGPETVRFPCAKGIRRCGLRWGAHTMRVIRAFGIHPRSPTNPLAGRGGCAGSLARFLLSLVHVEMGVRVEQKGWRASSASRVKHAHGAEMEPWKVWKRVPFP
jgi:hypothetical protein